MSLPSNIPNNPLIPDKPRTESNIPMIDAATLFEPLTNHKDTPQSVFWTLEPRLPLTAAKSAVEIDWLIQAIGGQPVKDATTESIRQLHELLSQSVKSDTAPRSQGKVSIDKAFADPLGESLFAKAYNASHQSQPLTTRSELPLAIKGIIESLKKILDKAGSDAQELKRTMEFCVALSEYAGAYRKMVYGRRPEHPYRK